MLAQLSVESSTPSTSASSFVAEQSVEGLWRVPVWQTPPPVQSVSAVQLVPGALLQNRATLIPRQSPSQESPMPSRSVSFWLALAARTQLSLASTWPSPSRSPEELAHPKPRDRSQIAVEPGMTGQLAATRHGSIGAVGV